MINLTIIFTFIWMHFIADFVLQTDKMALNKSTSIKWLGIHVLIYSLPFFGFGIKFGILTFISHFIIDFITSKVTSYFWKREERHWFFVTIGWDQAMHLSCFMLMLKYL